jgi:7-cyano-7-deazaguanine synthase
MAPAGRAIKRMGTKKNKTGPNRAVVLLSGGLDSTTVLAMATTMGFACYAMSFRYGQRHQLEVNLAARTAEQMKVADHRVVDIDLRVFGGSALTADIEVPKHETVAGIDEGIPVTYVPARNTIFLSYALAWAEVLGADDIFIGVNAVDYSGYPDCRPAFIEAFEKLARLATRAGVEGTHKISIRAPLIAMTKGQIIRTGMQLGVDYAQTNSCYDPAAGVAPCGKCDSCLLRAKGFEEAGIADPLWVKYHQSAA